MEFAPVPCIIDTDPGVDDCIAILLALSTPTLLPLSIVLTHGNCSLPHALKNLEKLFFAVQKHLEANPRERKNWPGLDREWREKWGGQDAGLIKVFLGREEPRRGDRIEAKYFHGPDGLSDVTARHPDLTPPSSFQSPFYVLSPFPPTSPSAGIPAILAQYPESTVAYLALGPLGVLEDLLGDPSRIPSPEAGSIQLGATLLARFSIILVMGGAVDVPGNTSPTAEFNIFADPYAAQAVLSLSLPNLYLLPLDITTPHTLPFDFYTSLIDPTFHSTRRPSVPSGKTPLAHFTSSFLERTREVMAHYGGGDEMELHDPVVIWAAMCWSQGGEPIAFSEDASKLSPEEMRERVEQTGFTHRALERRRSLETLRLNRGGSLSIGDGHARQRLPSVDETAQSSGSGDVDADEQDFLPPLPGPLPSMVAYDERFAPGWEWERREFEVETTGTLTRGMLVTDRRRSSKTVNPTPHLPRQTNRALAEEERERLTLAGSNSDPAAEEEALLMRGTKVIIATPGNDTLRTLMLKHIWGVSIGVP